MLSGTVGAWACLVPHPMVPEVRVVEIIAYAQPLRQPPSKGASRKRAYDHQETPPSTSARALGFLPLYPD